MAGRMLKNNVLKPTLQISAINMDFFKGLFFVFAVYATAIVIIKLFIFS